MVSSFHWFLFCVCLECPGRFGGSWAERVFGVGLGVAGKADGSQSPEPVSALPAGREPEITVHAIGRAVPTSQSSDMKTRKDFGDYLDLFFHSFHFIVREAGPGRMSDQTKTTEPSV